MGKAAFNITSSAEYLEMYRSDMTMAMLLIVLANFGVPDWKNNNKTSSFGRIKYLEIAELFSPSC